MPDWSDPLEILKDAVIYQKISLVLLGLTTWEIIVQLPFDWSIISRKREAHWPVFFYFLCKYSLWSAVISANVATNVTTKVNCQGLYTFIQFTVATATSSGSTLLMLRTIAVWNRARFVTFPLIVLLLGHWALFLHGVVTIHSSWSDFAGVCIVRTVYPVFLEANYLYTISFDFIVLVLTTIGLVRSPIRSSLWQLLFRQGVIYFLVAFIANMLPTIFLLLDLNLIMNIMFSGPAVVASSIVACRVFVCLANFQHNKAYVHSGVRYPPTGTRFGGSGSGGDIEASRDIGNSLAKSKRSMGNVIEKITFRNVAAGIDSMAQSYDMEELDASRTTGTVSVLDLKPENDFGGVNANGHVMVHTETMVHGHYDVDGVDLEKADSLSSSSGYVRKKSFVPRI